MEAEESDDGAALDYIQNLAAADDSEDLPEDIKVCCHPCRLSWCFLSILCIRPGQSILYSDADKLINTLLSDNGHTASSLSAFG